MLKKEFVRPGATTWGYGWVGQVGEAPTPPDWPEFIKDLLNEALDLARFSTIQWYMGALPIAWQAVYHPPDKTSIVDALEDANVVAYIANAHGEWWYAEVVRTPVMKTVDVQVDVKPAMEQRGTWPTKPMKFAFLIHSRGMNVTDVANTWSYELRKSNNTGSVVIGIKQDDTTGKMSVAQWTTFQTLWCSVFFTFVALGWTFDKAFRYTDWMFPDLSKFTVFSGDINMKKSDLMTP